MAKEDSIQLREEKMRRGGPRSNGTPKQRHGYKTPQRIRDRMVQLGEHQAMTISEKFEKSVELMKSYMGKVKKIFIGWSGGKDSTLVIDLVLATGLSNYEIVYVDSGVEPSETTDYIEVFSKLRGFEFKILKPPTTFWQMVITHGWPILGGDRFSMPGSAKANAEQARKQGEPKRAAAIAKAGLSGACSNVLKVAPMDRYAAYVGSDCTAMGLMALETRQRMLVWLQKGDFYWHKGNKKWIAWPIWFWKPADVIEYFRSNGIPMCALYDPGRLDRNGCQACGKAYKWPDNNWIDTYRFHPEIMDEYMVKRGLAKRLWELKKIYHADQIMRFGLNLDADPVGVWEKYPGMMLQL